MKNRVLSFLRDVSSRKKVEAELRVSESKFRAVIDNSHDAIGVHVNGIWEMCNPAAVRLFRESSAGELLGNSILNVIAPGERARIGEYVRNRGKGNDAPSAYLTRGLRSDGTEFDMEVTVSGFTEDGKLHTLVTLRDITERRRADEELRESEEKYHLVVDNLKEVVFQTDTRGIWEFLNPAWEEITGFRADESIGRLFLDFVHPDDRQRNIELFQPLIDRKKEYCRHEIRYLTKDGGFRWVEVYARLGLDDDDHVTGTYGTLTDITERKQAETSLRESESQFRELWHATVEGIAIHDRGIIVEVNDAICRMFRYEPVQLIGRSLMEFTPGEAHAELRERIASPKDGTFEMKALRSDGARLTLEVFAKQIRHTGRSLRMVAIRDITERKRAEQMLQESESRFRQLSEAALEGIAVTENGIVLDGNGRLAAMLGYELGEMIGRPVAEFIAPESQALVRGHMAENYEEGYEHFLLRKDGSTLPVESHARTMKWNDKTIRVTGLLDLSERKRAENQLTKLSHAVEQSPASIVITDTRGIIEYVNPKFTQITGYTSEEALGKNPNILKSGETPPEGYRDLWETITAGKEWRGEFHNKKKNGELFWEFASISPVKNKEGVITNFLAVKEDITERKRGEEALRQAQKLKSIGTLAGGIAHDFNNVLGGIIGYTDMSLKFAEKGSKLESNLLKVLKVSDRAKQLILQILTFSRKANPQKSVISLRPIVEDVLDLLKASIPSSVIIQSDVSRRTKPVLADATQIHEALLNLATNAVHAMNRKGTLAIRLYARRLEEAVYGQCGELVPGDYTVLEVADTGCGMDATTLSKAFEPFFTTKAVGEGTGMGLSVVIGVVQSLGGDILVDTEPGKGTTIRLYLPVTEDRLSGAAIDYSQLELSGIERILFVDDERMLVETAKDLLTPLGYRVTGISSSLEAIRLIKEKRDEFDVLITDQTMPGMTGIELAREVLAIRPHLPIILCTGFSDEVRPEMIASTGIGHLIMKPYRYDELAKALRYVIEKSGRE